MLDEKLYVRIKCPICHGTRHYSAGGYHDAMEPYKWAVCPYCDLAATTYVEVTLELLIERLKKLPDDKREIILQKLSEEF
jgi:hypothetical protein